MDWDGVTPKNLIMGRLITPSDLRHRAVIYVVFDANTLTNDKVPDYAALPQFIQIPADHLTQWETQELPREKIMIVSVRNLAKKDAKEFAAVFKPPKNADITNAVILARVTLTPIASAAMRLSREAITALPCLESIKLSMMTAAIKITMMPMRKVEFCGVPVMPCAPLM